MKHTEEAQIPAVGIMQTGDYGISKYYRIACTCGNRDDDVQMNIERDGDTVVLHVWTTVYTDWRRRFDYRDNIIIHYVLQRLNGILNRLTVAWTALTKGYVEMESWTLLNRQQALNLAATISRAVADVEKYDQQRDNTPQQQ